MPNNREWATLIWTALVVLAFLSRPSLRRQAADVIRAAKKLSLVFGIFLAYIAIELWIGYRWSLWDADLATDVVLWLMVSATALFAGFTKAAKVPHFFRNRILALIGVVEVLQFVTGLYVFSLPVELLVVPIVTALSILTVVAGSDSEHSQVKRLVQRLLVIAGFCLLGSSIIRFVSNWDELDWPGLAQKFALPLWLTIGLLPMIYLLALYSAYELAFIRLDYFGKGDSNSSRRRKLALVLGLRGQLRRAHRFTGPWCVRLAQANGFVEARQTVRDFLAAEAEELRIAEEEAARLKRYAGSDERDDDGRRLDRREFQETMDALRWLATCQMGWYDNQDRPDGLGYRSDLFVVLDDDFTHQGLPKPSGIEVHVSEDRQRWYAWRWTITGWCFAIGAAGPPPDQWEYDGPVPPSGYPGEAPEWGSHPYAGGANHNWQ